MQLDATDRRIIQLLQRDGRAAYAAIARTLGISEAAVRARVRDLTAAGVVAVRAVTDPLRLGFAVMALVGVSAGGDVERVGRLVAAREEASFVVATTGPYDLLVELACVDRRHLLEAVERLHATEGVDAIETFMYLSLEKESFVWGGAEGDGAPASA